VVTDASGTPLLADRDTPKGFGIDDGEKEIHPYRLDTSAVHPFTLTEHLKSDPSLFLEYVTMEPGQSLIASPSVLEPYRMVMRTVDAGKYIGTMRGPESVDMKDADKRYATPPPGFRRLKEYAFPEKGTYTAQFVINELASVQYAKAGGPTYRQKLAWVLYYLAGPPGPDDSWGVPVHVKSEKIKFKASE
jgi:hypothetical protein